MALAGPARQPRRPRRHSSKSVERNARTMTTVTSALSARAVRLGAPRKVTRRLPSPTPTAPPSWNQPSDCTPARRRPMASSRARPDAPHARDERLALAADHRHAPPSSEQVAVRRPARVTARAATNPDADPARKPSVAKGASRLVSTATLGGIPVSLATALPALADDGGGGGGAFGIVALIAVAGAAFVAGRGPAEAEVEEATTTIPHRRPGRRIPKTTRKISPSPAASRGRGGNLQSPRDCDAPDRRQCVVTNRRVNHLIEVILASSV